MSFPRRVRVPRPSSFFLSIDCRSSVYCRVGVMHIANTRFSLSRSIPRSRFVVQHALQLFAQYPFRVNVAGKVKLLNGRTEGCRYQAHARRIEESFERKWWACNYELCGDSLENSRGPMNKEKKALNVSFHIKSTKKNVLSEQKSFLYFILINYLSKLIFT